MNKQMFIFPLLSLFIFSCHQVKEQKISRQLVQAEVYLRYLQADKQLKAEISFSVADSIKKSVSKVMDEVLFQKKAMNKKKIQGIFRYQLSQTDSFLQEYSFEYSFDGSPFQKQPISFHPIEDFLIKGKVISKSLGVTVVFKGNLLKSNESIILLFSDENNKTTAIAIAGPSSDLGIFISPKQLKELTLGKGMLYMVRRQIINEDKKNFSLIGLTEYYSKVIDIEVVE